MKQKTPMQELIFVIRKRQEDEDVQPVMWLEQIVELAEAHLKKEKEVMCEFAEYTRKCGFLSDQRGLMTTEELYDETFNTKV